MLKTSIERKDATVKPYNERLTVYEDEVMELGKDIESYKRLIDWYQAKAWLDHDEQQVLERTFANLKAARERLAKLVKAAQMPLF